MSIQPLTIAMLSLHSSPIGPLGTTDTGGMSVYVRELGRCLAARDHRIDIYTCGDGRPPAVELHPRLRLVHLDGLLGGLPPKVALPTRLAHAFDRLEDYRRRHDLTYDLVHSHYWLSGVVGAMARERWHCPHVTMFHTLAARKNQDSAAESEPDQRLAAERRLATGADRVIVAAEAERRFLDAFYQVPAGRISIIPGGVDLDRFQPMGRLAARRQLSLPSNGALILYVGRFAPLKRVERLIAAVDRLRSKSTDVQMMIVGGDDPDAESTRALVAAVDRLQLQDKVYFAGRVPQEALPVYYGAADLLALPSDYESFGLVLLEALACGRPVAATSVGIAPELVREGINGTLLKDNDTVSLAEGIARLLSAANISAERIRATVTPYGWPGVATAMEDVYVSLLIKEGHRL